MSVRRVGSVSFQVLLLLGSLGHAQAQPAATASWTPVTDELLQNPPAQDWLMWRRTYDLSGHSPLDQINRDTVANLQLAWQIPLGEGGNMTTPLVHDGMLFIADTGNLVRAVDAATGAERWRYQHDSDELDGRRIGMALHGDLLVVPHNDLDVVALDARTGAVVWQQTLSTPVNPADVRGYYALRGAPVVMGDVIVQGVTATIVPQGGFIVGLDLATGVERWRFETVARPGTPGGETWNDLPLAGRSGGSVWIPGSYHPDLDLVFFGTAPTYDTAPLLADLGRPGVSNAALYTNTTLALRPRTGELVWYYQHMANDQWDLDWVYERQLTRLNLGGRERDVVFTAGKMALYDLLDAATGEYLTSVDGGITNMIAAIDPVTGAKTLDPIAIPNPETGHLLCPFVLGGRNWQAGAFDARTKKGYLPLSEMCMMGGPTGMGSLVTTGAQLAPRPRPDSDGNFGRIQMFDWNTQTLGWAHREQTPPTIATLSTKGGLVFTGFMDQSFKALDADTGAVLWETSLDHLPTSFPITYAVDGRQYVAVVRGQPSRFIGQLFGIIVGLMPPDDPLPVPNTTAALMVYALPE